MSRLPWVDGGRVIGMSKVLESGEVEWTVTDAEVVRVLSRVMAEVDRALGRTG